MTRTSSSTPQTGSRFKCPDDDDDDDVVVVDVGPIVAVETGGAVEGNSVIFPKSLWQPLFPEQATSLKHLVLV